MNESGESSNETMSGGYAYLSTLECGIAIVIYTLIAIAALVGNSVVIFIIAKFQRLRTPTNLLILNLAIADLLMALFCIPLSYMPNLILVCTTISLLLTLNHLAERDQAMSCSRCTGRLEA